MDAHPEPSDASRPPADAPVDPANPTAANDGLPPKPAVRAEKPAQRRLRLTMLLLVLLAAIGLLAWQHNAAVDWLVLRGYHPPQLIGRLASDDAMTPYARRLFYVDKPQIDGRSAFNQHCPNTSDQVTVLGCFVGNRQGIYIYDVTDTRLAGIQQVTAAHEMLHQAYQRLTAKDRAHVDDLLQAYAKTITDPDLKAKIAAYQKTEPHDVVNEMHSVFGTEVANLPPQLEQYYSRYFTNRSKITQYHTQYQAAFTERIQQLDSYDAQLDSLKKQITANKAQVIAQEQSLRTLRSQLNAYVNSNQIDVYNAAVPGFNAQVDTYKGLVAATNALIDQYNSLIDARNAIAVQEQQLQNAIDSRATAAPAQNR